MDKGTLLPVPCNQKMNSYLKEIADLCGIKKNLTTHTARHSFASVIALANNVSLPNVAKKLGAFIYTNDTTLRKGVRPNDIKGYASG